MRIPNWLRLALIGLLALVAGGVLRAVVANDHHRTKTTVKVAVPAPPEVDLRDPTPPGITPAQADDALITPPGLTTPQPPAGAQNYHCDPSYVRNYSDRSPGVKVSMFVLHFTVSDPGSIDAIRAFFDNSASQVSSHLGLELDGECQQWVPFSKKAWTEGAFNSVSESVEIVTRDLTRKQWLAAPILKDGILAQIVRDRIRARGIPAREVDPVGCSPKAGITDHLRLECGNTHVDVGKNFPWDVFLRQVKALDGQAASIVKARRSHRIVHAKIRKRCRGHARHSAGCAALFKRNGQLHARWGKSLGA